MDPTFLETAAKGDEVRDAVRSIFELSGQWEVAADDQGCSWDFAACDWTGRRELVEVKHDHLTPKTGNLCIETENVCQETGLSWCSGMAATESTVWVHILGNEWRVMGHALIYRVRLFKNFLPSLVRDLDLRTFNPDSAHPTRGYAIPLERIVSSDPPWAEALPIEELPASRVFQPHARDFRFWK